MDTGYYVGNAAGWVRLSAVDARVADLEDGAAWTDIVAKRRVVPDTRHRFLGEWGVEATHVRLDVYPDGGKSRMRLFDDLSEATLAKAPERWTTTRP